MKETTAATTAYVQVVNCVLYWWVCVCIMLIYTVSVFYTIYKLWICLSICFLWGKFYIHVL